MRAHFCLANRKENEMKRILCCFFVILLSFALMLSLASCDEAYTTEETNSLIAEINAEIKANKDELDAKIKELTAEYEADDTKNKAELEGKITALESAYYGKIAELISLIEEIKELDGTQNGKIDDLNGYVDEKIAEINKKHADDLSRIEEKLNEILSAHKHTFGDYMSYSGNENVSCDKRIFYRICTECAVIEWKSGTYESHAFSTVTTPPTCTSGGYDTNTCTDCGFVDVTNLTDETPHPWESEYRSDADYHWYKCSVCEKIQKLGEHTPDSAGECTKCGATDGNTKGLVFKLSSDESYLIVSGYEGTAKIVTIAKEYNGKPIKKILRSAFQYNIDITEINILADVDEITDSSFYSCINLKTVTLPDFLKSIRNDAFHSCSALENITFGTGLEYIGKRAFEDCESLTNVYISDIATWCNIDFDYCNPMEYAKNMYIDGVLAEKITIPDGTETIKSFAFYGFDSLKKITLPDSVTVIKATAFNGCTGLADENGILYAGKWVVGIEKSAKNAIIKDDTIGFADSAFANSAIESLTIPDEIKYIGTNAFESCKKLENLYINDLDTWLSIPSRFNSNPFPFAKSLYLNGELLTTLTIPEGTEKITAHAFEYCTGIKKLTIPSSVTTIENNAFRGCTDLETVIFADGIKMIEKYAFDGCTGIKTLSIPSSIESIDNEAFVRCNSISKIYYDASNTPWSTLLVEVGNPLNKVERVQYTMNDDKNSYKIAFFNLTNASTQIPSEINGVPVTEIDENAFAGSKLESITIPETIKVIGKNAFKDCDKLMTVIFENAEGWYCVTPDGDVAFEAIELQDTDMASIYLAFLYFEYDWKKS